MAKKSLNMIEKMMDPNIIDYYIINRAIPSIITIENRYQIDFGKPEYISLISQVVKSQNLTQNCYSGAAFWTELSAATKSMPHTPDADLY